MANKILLLFLIIVALAAGCRVGANETTLSDPSQPTPSMLPASSSDPKAQVNSPIRQVDFRNFQYVGPADYPETFMLKDGEQRFVPKHEDGISIQDISYADLTGDGDEEAIILMDIQTGGSAIPGLVFIYTSQNGKAEPLWNFVTGDRAEGGLKRAYSDAGDLIVELFGDDKFENEKWQFSMAEEKSNGLCCPATYTRFRFNWNGKRFVMKGNSESFDYDWKRNKQ